MVQNFPFAYQYLDLASQYFYNNNCKYFLCIKEDKSMGFEPMALNDIIHPK